MAKIDTLIEQAQKHLDSGEIIEAVIIGAYETKLAGNDTVRIGIFAATSIRLIFFAKKMFGYDLEVFPYENISSIEAGKDLMGHTVSVFASGNKAKMKWINEKSLNGKQKPTSEFVTYVTGRIGKQTNTPTSVREETISDKIKQLSELHNSGILTEEEFTAKKTELLNKM